MRTDVSCVDDSLIGGNKSAEATDEGTDSTAQSGVDIVLNCRLVESAMSKKDYMSHIKEYMKR